MNTNHISDKVCWYPLRAIYAQEIKIHQRLCELNIENYVPIRQLLETDNTGCEVVKSVPLVHNLIFVKATRDIILYYKQNDKIVSQTRFIIKHNYNNQDEKYLIIPNKQMHDFIKVVNSNAQNVKIIQNSDYIHKPGTKVRIRSGEFAGIEGVIKRIKRNKIVIVSAGDFLVMAISNLCSRDLEIINDK